MSNPARIFLRIVGLVLFAGSLAGVAYIVGVGPDQVAQDMGRNCSHSRNSAAENCGWRDVLGILQALPFVCLIGGVLLLVFRRESDDPQVTSGTGRGIVVGGGRFGILQAVGALAVVLIVVVNFVGVFVYRAGYTFVETKDAFEKVRDAPRPDFSGRPATRAPKADAAPKGLAPGSLLRAKAFRAAMADVRRAAPSGATLTRLRVAADRIDAEVLAGGRTVTLSKLWNKKAAVDSTTAATDGDTPLVAFTRLDPSSPQRAAVAAARSKGRSAKDVDYLVLFDAVGLRWNTFLKGGGAVIAVSPDGRRVQG